MKSLLYVSLLLSSLVTVADNSPTPLPMPTQAPTNQTLPPSETLPPPKGPLAIQRDLIDVQGPVSNIEVPAQSVVGLHATWTTYHDPARIEDRIRVTANTTGNLCATSVGHETKCQAVKVECCREGLCGRSRLVTACQYNCDTTVYFRVSQACPAPKTIGATGQLNVTLREQRFLHRKPFASVSQTLTVIDPKINGTIQ